MQTVKQIREDSALEQLSLHKIQTKLEEGVLQPSNYMALTDIEKLYVRMVLFERKSSTAAAKYITEKVNALGSFQYDAMAIEIEYRLNPQIQSAMRQIMAIKDIEYSAVLQDKGKLALDVITGIMLNSSSEELKLKAADTITRAVTADIISKRGKNSSVEIKQSKTQTVINWNIEVADKKNMIIPDQGYMDATVPHFKKEIRNESVEMNMDRSIIIPPEDEDDEERDKDPWEEQESED